MAQELGDSNRVLAQSANRFFVLWGELLRSHFDRAKAQGCLEPDADTDGLSRLVMSTIEGALLLCKASKDTEAFKKTAEALKQAIRPGRGA
ncbi:LmrA/YxaF family transcription factor [Desulfomonile tiedjei]|uniref:LmrA/YxaF family transcription factor n=1 Tax=Desulfomonile tiedjei TaxID=2358 RepID=UPI0023511858|nr:TetR family transcriptional regulator C-terminal domain-containing protein [Desulfomonile tiedjei]